MKRLGLVVALALLAGGGWWLLRPGGASPGPAAPVPSAAGRSEAATLEPPSARGTTASDPAIPVIPRALTPAEKVARIEQIKRDYDEVRAKIAAEYAAAGKDFPGGLNAFLRQLALLEREKRKDFATVLDAAELEALEYRETTAGHLVARLLDGTTASDALKRAVFRQVLAYEDRFALTFDLSPPALLARETARQALQGEIRAILGDALFATWLRGEERDMEGVARLVQDHGLPPERVFELWQAKSDFVRRRLEINTRGLEAAQAKGLQRELTREMHVRIDHLLGTTVPEPARREALGWLPAR